jgi:hypothetical protein
LAEVGHWSRLNDLADCLDAREFLLSHFGPADADHFAVLNWSTVLLLPDRRSLARS